MSENTDIFLNSEKFFKQVESLVREKKMTYIEATIAACTHFQVDPEDLGKLKLVNSSLKDRLHVDGMNEGYLKREAQLPI